MAVDVISPDARKKVDELFLYWLSEPSTQELLRHEVAKACGLKQQAPTEHHLLLNGSTGSLQFPRPASPTGRAITPPPPAPPSSLGSPSSPKLSRGGKKHCHAAATTTTPPANITGQRQGGEESTDGGLLLLHGEGGGTKTSGESSMIPIISVTPVPSASPSELIPRFYFPNGKREEGEEIVIEKVMVTVGRIFERYPRQEIPKRDFHLIVKALKLPFYWKVPLFKMIAGKNRKYAALASFKKTWLNITNVCHDDASRFVNILSHSDPDRNYLIPEDFEPLIRDIVECHPGLEFLRAAPEFHLRYIETVIGRIFYSVDKTWRRRIYAQDLRNSTFLQSLSQLDNEDDINKFTSFFSYEHFYVIYCKFWELDTDHDLIIDRDDLIRHSDNALTSKVVERLLSGVVTYDSPAGKMSYKDFVWFLISEEDKTSNRSIEYWFRVLDKDGDGFLSLYELEYFYEDILLRLDEMNIESLSVRDTICHVLDMINPKHQYVITLKDLKNSQLTSLFLNTFINLEKYMDYEQRDAVSMSQDDEEDGHTPTNWEKYASEQYELLVAEEQFEDEEEVIEEEPMEEDCYDDTDHDVY